MSKVLIINRNVYFFPDYVERSAIFKSTTYIIFRRKKKFEKKARLIKDNYSALCVRLIWFLVRIIYIILSRIMYIRCKEWKMRCVVSRSNLKDDKIITSIITIWYSGLITLLWTTQNCNTYKQCQSDHSFLQISFINSVSLGLQITEFRESKFQFPLSKINLYSYIKEWFKL